MGNKSNRTQRRKNERTQRSVQEADGLSVQNLIDAESELESVTSRHVSTKGVTWTAMVENWQALDYQRESTRLSYGRVVELRKLGRTTETERIVQIYAQTKQELQVLEDQMVAFLMDEDLHEEEIRSFLWDQRAVPGKPIMIRVPEELRELLTQRLELIESAPDGAAPVLKNVSSNEGSEVHGKDPE